ncbi:hypothetical protein [Lichenicola sp.]|uniref:hypothetical protein n=1 Tax=Lichenicola sp. TaxID=2804529 RepID=UPI003B00CF14
MNGRRSQIARATASLGCALAVLVTLGSGRARAQQIDLSHGGQVTVTALGGFDWNQNAQTVTAYGSAQAVRGGVTVTADRLIAYYRKKAVPPGAPRPGTSTSGATPVTPVAAGNTTAPTPAGAAATAAPSNPTPENPTGFPPPGTPTPKGTAAPPGDDTSASEIYRLEAIGHVHIFTATQQAFGDHGIYDIDQAVMVLTGHDLHLITPTDLLTARDQMEYFSQTRISIGRGDASVTTNDGRRIQADTLVGYSAPPAPQPGAPASRSATPAAKPANNGQDPIGSSGKLEKVNAFGNVIVRTQTETVRGDRGVYVPDTGIARIVGNVHITRGQNQLNGAAAIINMHTGIATMTEDPGARVQGLIVPNETQNGPPGTGSDGAAGARAKATPAKTPS